MCYSYVIDDIVFMPKKYDFRFKSLRYLKLLPLYRKITKISLVKHSNYLVNLLV